MSPLMRSVMHNPRGFTLMEVALATVIIGVGVLSMMQLSASCTQQNVVGGKMTTAMLLAQNIQEATADLPFADPISGSTHFGPESGETLATYNDADDFDGLSLNPPIDSLRTTIPGLSQYTQVVSVVPVDKYQLSSNTNNTIPKTTYYGTVRATVIVLYRAQPTDTNIELYRMSWIRVDK